jgi:hypothetical protein
MMKATLEGTELRINIYHLMEEMDEEEQRQMADALAVRDAVVLYVTQQILDGWTEHESNAGLCCVACSDPPKTMGLDWAVREVARRAGEVAASEVKRLERALRSKEEENAMLRKMLDERRYVR